ncbi:MAG TPA: GNAT family N-acetyltransferase [Chloroflexia bacterium]|nr:GNAT family N-acetyltransferase [Chloroflexia bacterium]
MELEIRQYRDGDYPEVWHLHNLALELTGAHGGNGPWDDDLHHIKQVYLDKDGEFLVGLHNGRILAMGAFRQTGEDEAEIKRMRVQPEYQGQGLGRQILAKLEERAREMGYKRLHLETSETQIPAQKLYTRHGFIEFKRGRVLTFNCIYYEKYLTESKA